MTGSLKVFEHLIPKALYASPIFLVGPELISRPSYPTARCSRGTGVAPPGSFGALCRWPSLMWLKSLSVYFSGQVCSTAP